MQYSVGVFIFYLFQILERGQIIIYSIFSQISEIFLSI